MLQTLPRFISFSEVGGPKTSDVWALTIRARGDGRPGSLFVFDAVTGEDVSRRTPRSASARLLRAAASGKPLLLRFYRLNAQGHCYLDSPDHVASDARRVTVRWA